MMQVWRQWQAELLATVNWAGDFEEQLASGTSLAAPTVARELPYADEQWPNSWILSRYELSNKLS